MSRLGMRLLVIGIAMSGLTLGLASPAFAHVVVKPAEVVSASFQTFTVSVPNEKDVAVTKVKVLIPSGVQHVSPTQKIGWTIATTKDSSGEGAAVTAITWSGGTISAGLRDDFTFSAQAPSNTTELQWKAYQTYADGTTVAWDKAKAGGHDDASGPFSVTNVVQHTAEQNVDQALAKLDRKVDFALYTSIAAIVVGLAGIYLATKK